MMNSTCCRVVCVLALVVLFGPTSAWAQIGRGPFRAVSLELGSLHQGRYGAEFETCAEHGPSADSDFYIGCFLSFGVMVHSGDTLFDPSGSRPAERARYIDGDVFVRMLFGQSPFNGWTFGLRTGATVVMPHGPRPGVGADTNRSWRFGRHLYVSPGVGVKAVLGMPEDANLGIIPTVRLNLGVAY
jgi:hypothetical protein